jgi:hypothetical protein
MIDRVRKFLKNHSPDWLNVEVNKDLLPNLSAAFSEAALGAIAPTQTPLSSTSYDENCSPRPELGEGLGVRADTTDASEQLESTRSNSAPPSGSLRERTLMTGPAARVLPHDWSLMTEKGKPHWRRINQVFQTLNNAPQFASYNQLIQYVRETTGVGCSRKLISKWKKQKLSQKLQVTSQKFPDNNSGDRSWRSEAERHLEERTAAISASPTIIDIPSTVNNLQLTDSNSLSTDNCSLMTVKAWSYLAAAGITIALVGCELLPFQLNNNRPNENIAIANVTAPLAPLPEIPERRKNQLEPRNIKIELTLSNPQDLKVKPGEHITAGQVLSDRADERNRLQVKKKQLQLSLEKLNLPLTPIAQPKPIPEIAELPPVSYAEAEAAIKLHKQKLKEAEQAIALQQKKIDSLTQLQASPSHWGTGGGEMASRGTEGNLKGSTPNLKLILSHEQAVLKNLEAARQQAQIQLELAQSQLTTAKENRAYAEYQRQLEQTRRAIALQQQQQAIQQTESERSRLLAEREYSKAQIETQIQALDSQIHQLSTVTAPYEGTIKKIKWTGQSDHNLTVELTLDVNSDRSTIANSTVKPTPTTEVRETREEDK